MKVFEKAKWIWAKGSLDIDDYIELKDEFVSTTDNISIRISCDSVYAIYLNNELIKFMNCSDYPFYKYYDEFLLPCHIGQNEIRIQVWHYGVNSQAYYKSNQGLVYEVIQNNKIISYSSNNSKVRIMNEYKNGYGKIITDQLGMSFYYDNTIEKSLFESAIEVDKTYDFHKREINAIELRDREEISIRENQGTLLVDLGKEIAGLLDIDIDSDCDQLITIAYGEHIDDGMVRRKIANRDFSVEFYAKKGNNKYLNPFRRLAGRYLEFHFSKPIKINYAGIRSVMYKHEIINKDFNDELINVIYQTSIRTLELCMHEHYEDCPWREQNLYAEDSRNQALCGYYVFKGYEYQRHNLVLLSKSLLENGMLALTSPCGYTYLNIPSFSLMYIKEVEEYIAYTKDASILDEVGDVIKTIMKVMLDSIDETNLIKYFEDPVWNFYEWTEESFNLGVTSKNRHDLIINAMLLYVIPSYNRMFNENIDLPKTKEAIQKYFYLEDEKVYKLHTDTEKYSQLGNSLCALIGLGNDELLEKIIKDENMITASLSMRCFLYDALLTNKDKYSNYIIEDIKMRYKKMLDAGATSFWETEIGQADFDNAGSLCHGWSAIPIYYFNLLLK